MKRKIWIVVMVAVSLSAGTSLTTVPASAFASCGDTACKRNNHCTPQCSGCDTPSPIFWGNCEVRI